MPIFAVSVGVLAAAQAEYRLARQVSAKTGAESLDEAANRNRIATRWVEHSQPVVRQLRPAAPALFARLSNCHSTCFFGP